MPDRVFCRRHDPDGHANWDSGFRPLLDDTCYMCAAEQLEQQLISAHRDATEEVAKAHKRGWEQCRREAQEVAKQTDFPPSPKSYYTLGREDAANAIAAMEYGGKANE